jgi:hydroxymethylbilane synthase
VTTLRLATRTSMLALAQADAVGATLGRSGIGFSIVGVTTDGDRRVDVPIDELGGTGAFTAAVQCALLDGSADVAVHSAKDLPSVTPPGLVLAAVPQRADPADALVGRALAGLGPGARVATGSPRRRALLLERRPDLDVVGLRGNVPTRLGKVGVDGVAAVVVAMAALERLGITNQLAERLDPTWFVPQVGQGALALEARADDPGTLEVLSSLTDPDSYAAVICERAFLGELGAGCTVPVAAHATVNAGEISVTAVMAAPDGSRVLRATESGRDPATLGRDIARLLRDELGGGALLDGGLS